MASRLKSEDEHVIGMYLDGKWYRIVPLSDSFNKFDPIERLDASILSRNLLDPISRNHQSAHRQAH